MRSKSLNEDEWRQMLLGKGGFLQRTHRLFLSLPSDPRCKLCQAPYGGIAGPVMTMLGFGKYPGNPQLCNACFRSSAKNPGGAEIELTVLFADVRGSTGLGRDDAARRVFAPAQRVLPRGDRCHPGPRRAHRQADGRRCDGALHQRLHRR